MPKLSHPFAFIALALWLFTNWAGAHGHFCFDGQEPPVAMHMDVMGDHLDHHADEVHQDADLGLAKTVLAKLSKVDLSVLLIAVLSLLLVFHPQRFIRTRYQFLHPRKIPHTWPPLRAPPVTA
jgi:hypothetical protein